MAQLVTVELDLITECDDPKTREEIWEHSYEAGLKNNGQLDENAYESMWGWTSESCWSTNRIQLNEDKLWYSNRYSAVWTNNVNVKCVMFGFVTMYCLGIIIYSITTLIQDIIAIKKDKLHEKSESYKYLLDQLKLNNGQNTTKIEENLMNKFKCIQSLYKRLLGTDTTGWIIKMFVT